MTEGKCDQIKVVAGGEYSSSNMALEDRQMWMDSPSGKGRDFSEPAALGEGAWKWKGLQRIETLPRLPGGIGHSASRGGNFSLVAERGHRIDLAGAAGGEPAC